jgi:hypothetical protein
MSNNQKGSNLEKAWNYYERIKDALNGLFEILNVSMEKDNPFYQFALDNIKSLKDTIIDLLEHEYNPAEIKRKLRDLEFDIKKSLFFEKDQKKDEEE